MKHDLIAFRPAGFGVLTLLTLVWIAAIQTVAGQNTAFTYQGRLNAGGGPANGVYDLTFQSFDALTGGSSVGGTVNVNGVGVTNGLFTALVDLGTTPFTGPARWLQIGVSTNGAGNFTILTPRQPLTPAPYAIYANTAGTVTNGGIGNAQVAANAVAAANIQNSTITAGKIASGQVVKSLNGLTDAVSLTQGANVTINTVGNSLQISAPAGGLNLPFSGTATSGGSIFTLANVLLSWSTAYPDYRLQSLNSLDAFGPFNFVNVTSPPTHVSGKFVVTNATSTPTRYFRLAK